jgi:glycosyltransferase involved in cell wall biosynthesis
MKVVSSVINDISTDQRVMKQSAVLESLGCDVTIVCRRRSGIINTSRNFKTVRLAFFVNRGPVFYFIFNARLLMYLFINRFDIYIANDLDTLLPNYIISRLRRKPLVYDSHEYFTGQYGLEERRFAYSAWKYIEKRILPNLKHMITVSDSIAELYHSEYGIKPEVIRNVAFSSREVVPVRREAIGVNSDDLLLVIQGTGLNPGRGVIELLDALQMVSGVHLLIIGSGDALGDIKMKISDLGLNKRVTIIPSLPWNEMMKYTWASDVGLSLDKDNCTNQKYSLPNKLFDYLSAGIPVIASPLPEICKIISEFNCGIVTEAVTPESVSEAIIKLRDHKELIVTLKEGALRASKALTWEKESEKETMFFRRIIEEYNKH